MPSPRGPPPLCVPQVCNLSWSKNVNELVSTHGYSQNQIIVWRYPSMQKLSTLTGHTMRVLYLAVSPDGQTIVTGAAGSREAGWQTYMWQQHVELVPFPVPNRSCRWS